MPHPIDVIVIDPSSYEAARTVAAVRRAAPNASTVRVHDAKHAIRLIFERGLFTLEPQVPRLIFLEPQGIAISARQLLQRLRARSSTRNLPVIVWSSASKPGEIAQSLLMGARDHIVKPWNASQYDVEVERATCLWLHEARVDFHRRSNSG